MSSRTSGGVPGLAQHLPGCQRTRRDERGRYQAAGVARLPLLPSLSSTPSGRQSFQEEAHGAFLPHGQKKFFPPLFWP